MSRTLVFLYFSAKLTIIKQSMCPYYACGSQLLFLHLLHVRILFTVGSGGWAILHRHCHSVWDEPAFPFITSPTPVVLSHNNHIFNVSTPKGDLWYLAHTQYNNASGANICQIINTLNDYFFSSAVQELAVTSHFLRGISLFQFPGLHKWTAGSVL